MNQKQIECLQKRYVKGKINFLSLCSGIEAASVAWQGWNCVGVSEIDAEASAVLAHHYPDVPNLGDMTAIDGSQLKGFVDVLVAGTPCQAFSMAGRRDGLEDARGQLTLKFVELCDAIEPDLIVWENVLGVLSQADNAFGHLLGKLAGESEPFHPDGAGTKWPNAGFVRGSRRSIAWIVKDAQHFGVPQRRRRIFLVAFDLRWSPNCCGIPAAILFDIKQENSPVQIASPSLQLSFDFSIETAMPKTALLDVIDSNWWEKTHRRYLSRPAGSNSLMWFFEDHASGLLKMLSTSEKPPVSKVVQLSAILETESDFQKHSPEYTGLGIIVVLDVARSLGAKVLPTLLSEMPDRFNRSAFAAYLRRYFLTTKGAEGVLRRNEARGRKLPTKFKQVLEGMIKATRSFDMPVNSHSRETCFDIAATLKASDGGVHSEEGCVVDTRETCVTIAATLRAVRCSDNESGFILDDRHCVTLADTLTTSVRNTKSDFVVDDRIQAINLRSKGTSEVSPTLQAKKGGGYSLNYEPVIFAAKGVPRRFTPVEKLRLQGFPDNYFQGVRYKGKPLSDSAAGRLTGNSIAVPCLSWIQSKIDQVLGEIR